MTRKTHEKDDHSPDEEVRSAEKKEQGSEKSAPEKTKPSAEASVLDSVNELIQRIEAENDESRESQMALTNLKATKKWLDARSDKQKKVDKSA